MLSLDAPGFVVRATGQLVVGTFLATRLRFAFPRHATARCRASFEVLHRRWACCSALPVPGFPRVEAKIGTLRSLRRVSMLRFARLLATSHVDRIVFRSPSGSHVRRSAQPIC